MLKGITVILYEEVVIGTDDFNRPITEERPVLVDNVLVAPVSDNEVLDTLNLTGKKAIYQLAIPKGDTHDWENKRVYFFGHDYTTIGACTEGIEEMIPLKWNKKIKVERYENRKD